MMPGGMEWLLIAFVVLLLFGGKKIPELMKGLGSGIKNFKKAVKDEDEIVDGSIKDEKIEKKDDETIVSKDTTEEQNHKEK